MASEKSTCSLEKLEYYSYRRESEKAASELLKILQEIDRNSGSISKNISFRPSTTFHEKDRERHFATRAAGAISALFSEPNLGFKRSSWVLYLTYYRWISAIFCASDFGNSDHILRTYNLNGPDDLENINVDNINIFRYFLLYNPSSKFGLNLDLIGKMDKSLAISFCMSLISPRFLGDPAAHQKREDILPWLTKKISDARYFGELPVGILHDVYMHCSYADRKNKHDVKKSISNLMRNVLEANNIIDTSREVEIKKNEKPVMLVIIEWFTSNHSIYRTHSKTIEASREKFHVVGMGLGTCVDELSVKVFDEFITINSQNIFEQLKEIRNVADERCVQILYMPSVGMFQTTMWLTSVRFAPLQCIALGHPATTHSPAIDYVVVEEDYIGDPACFSEELLVLPKDGMPYRPSSSARPLPPRVERADTETVHVAVCATTMKLNPGFLKACQIIRDRSQRKVHFHFLVGQSLGLVRVHVEKICEQFLGDSVTVYPHQNYEKYMEVIVNCNMFINPFPFGNTNGIIDTVTAGLVGVCLSGDEVHEHIDEGIFKRLAFPDWLIARSVDGYIDSAIRLIDNESERIELSQKLSGVGKASRMFEGRPEIMGKKLLDVLRRMERRGKGRVGTE